MTKTKLHLVPLYWKINGNEQNPVGLTGRIKFFFLMLVTRASKLEMGAS